MVAALAFAAGCGAKGGAESATSTSTAPTTAATTAPSSTATTTAAPPPSAASTTAPPTTVACDTQAIAAAAFTKEGINPDDPGYQVEGVDPPGVVATPICSQGWAFAVISRPNVGTTDGGTLFHSVDGKWTEVSVLGSSVDYCSIVGLGVPPGPAASIEGSLGNPTTGNC